MACSFILAGGSDLRAREGGGLASLATLKAAPGQVPHCGRSDAQ